MPIQSTTVKPHLFTFTLNKTNLQMNYINSHKHHKWPTRKYMTAGEGN